MSHPDHLNEFRWVNAGQVKKWEKTDRPDGRRWNRTVHSTGCRSLGEDAQQLTLPKVVELGLHTCSRCGGDGFPISESKPLDSPPEPSGTVGGAPLRVAEPPSDVADCLERLRTAERYPLRELLQHLVPKTTGVYALWRSSELLYVGISTRMPADTINTHAAGVQGRLRTYYDARATNDFVLSVVLRYLIPTFSPDQIAELARGALGKNHVQTLAKAWLYSHVELQAVTADAKTATAAERVVMRDGLGGSNVPLLNGAGQIV